MAVRFKITEAKRAELHRLLRPVLAEKAERIADACNAESSWGFYKAYQHEDAARVAVLNQASDARTNRLLRQIEAGRVSPATVSATTKTRAPRKPKAAKPVSGLVAVSAFGAAARGAG